MFFIVYKAVQIINHTLVGWWVGFGCGWAKLNVVFLVGKCVGKTPLLILRSVGILSSVFSTTVYVLHGRPAISANVLQLPEGRDFYHKT
jgi:hypothetical protein